MAWALRPLVRARLQMIHDDPTFVLRQLKPAFFATSNSRPSYMRAGPNVPRMGQAYAQGYARWAR
jgi:hypothetical protein